MCSSMSMIMEHLRNWLPILGTWQYQKVSAQDGCEKCCSRCSSSDDESINKSSDLDSTADIERQEMLLMPSAAGRTRPRRYAVRLKHILLFSLLLLVSSLVYNFYLRYVVAELMSNPKCVKPAIRREWRSLAPEEKLEYISAVNCLREQPSRLGMNHSHYDDFPWTHNQVGAYSHSSAAFVVWHRYFIYSYEKSLREVCKYNGHLVYWDWTLDWQDITKAPVWGDKYGFGGNGNPALGDDIVEGYCVDSGPFANLQVLYVKNETEPHCLSRGFSNETALHAYGKWLSPQTIERLMLEDEYEKFNLGLENAAHNAIPQSIRGDFALFTAPYVFFLHHTQIDRLFKRWQDLNAKKRGHDYQGAAARDSKVSAKTSDIVPMAGLLPDMTVEELLDTRAGMLCYDYL